MPVDLLLCEGGDNSPDVRLLTKLLAGYCGEIRPAGGRYGMGERILARREVTGNPQVAGILDGDFPTEWRDAVTELTPWDAAGERLGWRWARKEVENYLVDPDVVSRALRWNPTQRTEYTALLDFARDAISEYQAARTALSNSRKRFSDLPSKWGRPRGRDKHEFPDDLSLAACHQGIQENVIKHGALRIVNLHEVLQRFDTLLPEFMEGGSRRRDFLCTYAGKDLLIALDSDLQRIGFANSGAFREKVLLGIESTDEDIANWVAEWAALRAAIISF